MLKAIETRYKGYRFRSRLEARWAVFFDAANLAWRYEPEGFECGPFRYLPDFFLPDLGIYLEIKPDLPYDCCTADHGAGIMMVDGKYTALGKFIIAALHLLQREKTGSEHPVFKQGIFLLCGTPGVPKLQEAQDGSWSLRDGAVALQMNEASTIGGSSPETPPFFVMNAWCGPTLEINLYYPFQINSGIGRDVMTLPLFPAGKARSLYIGQGRNYASANLLSAYQAARSARFEHGESPRY